MSINSACSYHKSSGTVYVFEELYYQFQLFKKKKKHTNKQTKTKTFYCNDSSITEFDMIDTKISATAYLLMYKMVT